VAPGQNMKFVDRKKELKFLQDNLVAGGLIIVYGRRRIGKTEILKQLSVKNKSSLVKQNILAFDLNDIIYDR
jgi:AAA+ ATPase superfamily predicted ATPase